MGENAKKTKTEEARYVLTVTKEQAGVIDKALEIYARLGMGQFRDALEVLPTREPFPKGWHDDMRDIGAILSKHAPSNYGIAHEKVAHGAKVAWDARQVIRHRLAWDGAVERGLVDSPDAPRNWGGGMMGVCYDDPLPVSGGPMVRIEAVKADEVEKGARR